MRLLLQAVYFFILARVLGAAEYGAFVGSVVVLAAIAPLAGGGVGHLLIRDAVRDPGALPDAFGDAVLVITAGTTFAGVLVLAASGVVFPESNSLGVVVLLIISDVICAQLGDLCAQCFQATGRVQYSAVLQAGAVALRLVAVVVLTCVIKSPTATNWMIAYSSAGIMHSTIAMWIATRSFRPTRPVWSRAIPRVRESWPFAVAVSAQYSSNDADKMLLGRFASFEVAGAYSAAYRLIDVVYAPVRSLMYAAYSKSFAVGADGAAQSWTFAVRILRYSGSYSLGMALTLWLVAPTIPLVLGESFRESVAALRWLAPVLPARALQVAAADAIAGVGYYTIRMWSTVCVVMLNVALNIYFVPIFSWRAAAALSVLGDASLALVFWLVLRFRAKKGG